MSKKVNIDVNISLDAYPEAVQDAVFAVLDRARVDINRIMSINGGLETAKLIERIDLGRANYCQYPVNATTVQAGQSKYRTAYHVYVIYILMSRDMCLDTILTMLGLDYRTFVNHLRKRVFDLQQGRTPEDEAEIKRITQYIYG